MLEYRHVITNILITVKCSTSPFEGFDVIAEKTVQVTNEEQSIVWEGYGHRLYIPSNALPLDVSQFQLKMAVALSGTFQFPEDGILVSAVYSFSHNLGSKELRQPVTLEIQHCATTSALSDLQILRASTHSDIPYKFETCPDGDFISTEGYGKVKLNTFSLIGIWKRFCSIFGSVHYCAKIFYTAITPSQFNFEICIIQDMEPLSEVCGSRPLSYVYSLLFV